MTGVQALQLIIEGKKMTRDDWRDGAYACVRFLPGMGRTILYVSDFITINMWVGELLNNDWKVYE